MFKFKEGSVVRCISPGGEGNRLTKGELYRIVYAGDETYVSVAPLNGNEDEIPRMVWASRFEKL